MKTILFWLAIVFTSFVPLYILASDNPRVEACIRLLNNIKKSTDDPDDPVTSCKIIRNSYAVECVERVVAGFTKYPTTDRSEYDGIDTYHLLACSFFDRHSSVKCLSEILTRRRLIVLDILGCEKK